jgi:creatinine amidohydrolase
MRLQHISWPRAKDYFSKNDLVIIGVGSNECHGRHIALGTDTLVPEKIIDLIEEKAPEYLIAPFMPYGNCDDLMGYPGSVSLGPDVLSEVMTKITDSLYGCGARRFAIVNGHGGNIRTLEEVGCSLNRRGAWCALLNWWKIAGELNPEWTGGHGGGQETAALMAINPDLVKRELIADQMLINDAGNTLPTNGFDFVLYKGVNVSLPRDVHCYSRNGWIGRDHPKDATEAWGREMLEATADYIVDFLDEFSKIPLPVPPEKL